jgi:hypothetical protein
MGNRNGNAIESVEMKIAEYLRCGQIQLRDIEFASRGKLLGTFDRLASPREAKHSNHPFD